MANPQVSFVKAISHGPHHDIHENRRGFTWEHICRVDNVNNDELSHLTGDERECADQWQRLACEFALHPYKSHLLNSPSRICKPTLQTRLAREDFRELLRQELQVRLIPENEAFQRIIKQEEASNHEGQYSRPPVASPFSDTLWDAAKGEIRRAIQAAQEGGTFHADGDLVIVQADNRPAGQGSHTQDHPTYNLFHNFTTAVGAQLGLIIRFQTNQAPFDAYSPFWISTILFSCVVGIFREVDILYMDTDLCIFPTHLFPRLQARPDFDTLHVASDVNSPLNAGLLLVVRGSKVYPSTLHNAIDPAHWDQKRLLCQQKVRHLLQRCTLPLAQTLIAFSTEELWTLETWESSASVLLAAVWGTTGLDRVRPQNVEEFFLMHAIFSKFGSMHWPIGARKLLATPFVSDNNDAIRATEWAHNVYEQLPLYWVTLATDATSPGIVCVHSGEGGMMVNRLLEHLPQIDLDECMLFPPLTRVFTDLFTPREWKKLFDDLYIYLHSNNTALLNSLVGQCHFPASVHAYGKTKRQYKA